MEFLFEMLGELIVALDGFTLLADIYAWMKGKENRLERREARRRGDPAPPRDTWNRRVIWLTAAFLVLTAGLMAWKM